MSCHNCGFALPTKKGDDGCQCSECDTYNPRRDPNGCNAFVDRRLDETHSVYDCCRAKPKNWSKFCATHEKRFERETLEGKIKLIDFRWIAWFPEIYREYEGYKEKCLELEEEVKRLKEEVAALAFHPDGPLAKAILGKVQSGAYSFI